MRVLGKTLKMRTTLDGRAVGVFKPLTELALADAGAAPSCRPDQSELGAHPTTLAFRGCSRERKPPEGIVGRRAGSGESPAQAQGRRRNNEGEDFAALRKLRDDASGALKKKFGDEAPLSGKRMAKGVPAGLRQPRCAAGGWRPKVTALTCPGARACRATGRDRELGALTEPTWRLLEPAALPDAIGSSVR